ncbi:MAG: hypothetical protein AB7S70_08155 [Hyphomicrobium sp.]|uniref:hypothetical protein n=1 Tax=Hyphomicrobium sp. TaxID=82 RepID=UPI003D0A6DE4
MQSFEGNGSGGADAAKLDELKRMLRRLDQAAPRPAESAQDRARHATAKRTNATAWGTVVLAGGVSLIVSLGVATLLVHDTPLRRFIVSLAPSGGEVTGVSADGGSVPATSQPTAFKGETAALRTGNAPRLKDEPRAAQTAATEVPAAPSPLVETARATEPAPAASPKAAVQEAEAAPAGAALVELDAAQFLSRGLAMLSRGGLNAGQLLLERAADLGSGEAAYVLASTYDPDPGAPRHSPEVRPNAELALRWYARADELGYDAARQRLSALKGGR